MGRGGPASQAPEEELGTSLQCARTQDWLAAQHLAQGVAVLCREVPVAQLQLLQLRGDLAP